MKFVGLAGTSPSVQRWVAALMVGCLVGLVALAQATVNAAPIGAPVGAPNPVVPAQACSSWAGVWQWRTSSGYTGPLTLSQNGNQVTGRYEVSTESRTGTVTGTASQESVGLTLVGAWTEAGGAGGFRWVMARDCQSFDGTWGNGSQASGGGGWSGTRSSATASSTTSGGARVINGTSAPSVLGCIACDGQARFLTPGGSGVILGPIDPGSEGFNQAAKRLGAGVLRNLRISLSGPDAGIWGFNIWVNGRVAGPGCVIDPTVNAGQTSCDDRRNTVTIGDNDRVALAVGHRGVPFSSGDVVLTWSIEFEPTTSSTTGAGPTTPPTTVGHGAAAPTPTGPSLPLSVAQPVACTWAGTWDIGGWGTLTLTQNGNQITGSYTNPAGSTVTGTVAGNRATGVWTQPNGSGGFDWTLGPSCSRFEGRWGSGASATNGGSWIGARIGGPPATSAPPPAGSAPPAGCSWLGEWRWGTSGNGGTMTLTQSGAEVTGQYYGHNSRVTGTPATENGRQVLTGTWTYEDRSGRFHWVMAADCRSFAGTHGDGSSVDSRGPWTGDRTGPAPPPTTAPPTTTSPPPTSSQPPANTPQTLAITGWDWSGYCGHPSTTNDGVEVVNGAIWNMPGGCHARFLNANSSWLTIDLTILGDQSALGRCGLDVLHLTSRGDNDTPGFSPVRISLNGETIYEGSPAGGSAGPGGVWNADRINVTGQVRSGLNTIRWDLLDATSHYWLKSFNLNCAGQTNQAAPGAPSQPPTGSAQPPATGSSTQPPASGSAAQPFFDEGDPELDLSIF